MTALIDDSADNGNSLLETTGRLMDFDHTCGMPIRTANPIGAGTASCTSTTATG